MERPTIAPKPTTALFFKKFLRLTAIFALAIPSSLEEKIARAKTQGETRKMNLVLVALNVLLRVTASMARA
jgi:hypothetical protein